MIVVFWDIDGTLLTTGRAGIFAWEDACREVTGHDIDFRALKTDGLTDHQVAAAILAHAGVPADRETLLRLVTIYEARLPGRLPMRQGRVLEGVMDILQHFRQSRPDIHSMLLTGNTAAGAGAKLRHYGLDGFFEGGSFSSDSGPRADIAARALSAVRARFPDTAIHPDHVFVVGDTPHDVHCARAIGARSVAVASGVYTREQLAADDPWMVIDRLPDPAAFAALLDRAVAEREGPAAAP